MISLEKLNGWISGFLKGSPERWARVLLGVLVVMVTALNIAVLDAPLILDDLDEMQHVQAFESIGDALSTPDCYGLFRPVKNLFFFVVASGGGFSTPLRHVIAGLASLLASLLFFKYADRLLEHRGWAALCALVWALAPTMVSSIAWFSCVNILGMAVFLLAGMLLYDSGMREAQSGARYFTKMIPGAGCFFLAILSYEAAVVFPVLLFVHDMARKRRLSRRALWGYGCFGAVAGAALAVRFAGAGRMKMGGEGFSPMTEMQTILASGYFALDHLALWLFPMGRQEVLGTFVWGKSIPVFGLWISWALLVALVAVLLLLWKKMPLVSMGMLWYFAAFSPMSNLVPLRNGPFADYYLVLPGMGLAIALVALARRANRARLQNRPGTVLRKGATAAIVLLILWRSALAALSFDWAAGWRSPADLFSRSVRSGPCAFRARANLARIYRMAGYPDEAELLARQSIEDAPWYALSYNVLGDVENVRGAYAAACTNYALAVTADPNSPYPYFAMAYIHETHLNNPEAAVSCYQRVLAFPWNRYSETAALNLSRLHAIEGNIDTAIDIIENALKYAPQSSALRHNLDVARGQREGR